MLQYSPLLALTSSETKFEQVACSYSTHQTNSQTKCPAKQRFKNTISENVQYSLFFFNLEA